MSDFKVYDSQSAPEGSGEILEAVKNKYGFVPNLFGVLAESPAALEAYTSVGGALEKSSLTPVEQQVVLLSTSFENGCTYCIAAHSTVARMVGTESDVVNALRNSAPIPDPRLEALRTFTRRVVEKRGWVSSSDIESFLSAGFDKRQILEVLTGVTLKTLSNYTNHITQTPLDEAFESDAWTEPKVKVTG